MKKHVIINLPYEDAKELFKVFDSLNESLNDLLFKYCKSLSKKQFLEIKKAQRFVTKVRFNVLVGLNKYNDKERS